MKLLFIYSIILFFSATLNAEAWIPKIKLINGTNGQMGRADTIKLIALSGGMVPIFEDKEKSGEFTLPTQNVDERVPVLIQVQYKGVNYNKMVPPVPQLRQAVQEVLVYEVSDDSSMLSTRGLLQITKGQGHIRVHKLFLLSNRSKPPRSYSNSAGLEVFVPKNALEVTGQLTQGERGMPVPLSLTDGIVGKIIERPILPGESSLQVSYLLPMDSETVVLDDRLTFEKENQSILFYKPIDMQVTSSNALETIEDEIPEGMKAYRIQYDANRSVSLVFKGGTLEKEVAPRQRRIVNGKVFDTTEKSVLGVIAVLALLFSLSFLFTHKKTE